METGKCLVLLIFDFRFGWLLVLVWFISYHGEVMALVVEFFSLLMFLYFSIFHESIMLLDVYF